MKFVVNLIWSENSRPIRIPVFEVCANRLLKIYFIVCIEAPKMTVCMFDQKDSCACTQ